MDREYVKSQFKRLNTEFKYRLPTYLKYQIFTKILLSIVILPIFTVLINAILNHSDATILTNSQVLRFGFSKSGLLVMLLFYIATILITLLEIGGLIVINNELLYKKTVGDYYSIIKFVLARLPKFFGIGGVFSILFIFFFIGLTGYNIFLNLGVKFVLPPFIKTYIDENIFYTFLYLTLIFVLIFLSIKWIFSMHFILLENKSGLKALKSSSKLIKNNLKLFISYLISGIFAILITFTILYILWNVFLYLILLPINKDTAFGKTFFILIMLISQFVSFLTSFFIVPLFVYFVTDIYYLLNDGTFHHLSLYSKSNKNIIDRIFYNKKNRFILFFLIIFAFTIATISTMSSLNNLQFNTDITAHKANSIVAIENTLEALNIAIIQDVDYVELDVQESKDGKLFLFHDGNFKRLANLNKNSNELNYSEIKKLDISTSNSSHKGSDIPLLDEAILIAKKNKQKLNLDIKVNTNLESISTKLVKTLEENNFISNCIVSSLDYDFLQEVKSLNSNIKTAYHMYLITGDLTKLNVDILSIEETALNQKVINSAHTLGKEVHVWTVNTKDSMTKFIKMGVDNIITDEVETLQNLLIQLKEDKINAKLSKFKLGIDFILLY